MTRKLKQVTRKHISIWLKPELLEQIDTLSQFTEKTRSQTIEYMLERGLGISAFQTMVMNLKTELEARWKANAMDLPAFKIFNTDLIIKRDNNVCQKCGSKENLIVYHINRDKNDFDIANLITLCLICTAKAETYVAPAFINESFAVWFYLIKN